jgi:hypothetical protein
MSKHRNDEPGLRGLYVEVRNNVRNMFPMLPTDLKLAPSALTPLAKEQINFLRKEHII